MTDVIKPIFLIGTGRCGSTALAKFLSTHRDLAWPSNRMLHRENVASQNGDTSDVDILSKPRRFLHEPWDFWTKYHPGFAAPCRDLDERDVWKSIPAMIRSAFGAELTDQRKSRFMTKYTGWSRIRFILEIFPDARFVHVVRDARAVAYSLNRVYFWRGWEGPSQWRWGPLSPDDQQRWHESAQSFFVLAGIQWKMLVENIREQGTRIPAQYMELRYEDFVNDTDASLRKLCDFTEIASDSSWMSQALSLVRAGMNEQWHNELPKQEIEAFQKVLGQSMHDFGYNIA